MIQNLLAELKKVPEFGDLSDHHLHWLIEKGFLKSFEPGDYLFRRGQSIDHLHIILRGRINAYLDQAGQRRSLGDFEPYDITGILPYSRMQGAVAEGYVSESSIVFALSAEHFHEMICDHHDLTEVLVHAMTDRVRDTTRQQQLNDKMMALGKLSAGLAHELNNPSAAVVRSASELKKHLTTIPEKFKSVIKIKAADDGIDAINDLLFSKLASAGKKSLPLMEKTALEDDIVSWLEPLKCDNDYEIAETFADAGFDINDLEAIRTNFREQDIKPVLNWINQVLVTERLVLEIEEASRRINDLVTSIKSYTHMDQAVAREKVDIHTGIRNTLTMLKHKVKKGNIEVIENFQQDLPEVTILSSEMNQVWTNLIDNAVDALENIPKPTLELKTYLENGFVNVCIIDNGPGIPDTIRDKIFDPFYTTKAIGKGTGLGLEVVRQIVNQHNGQVYVNSTPGRTAFRVCLPL